MKAPALIEQPATLQVRLVRVQVVSRALRQWSLPPAGEGDFQSIGDGARDLVLDLEDLLELSVVALGPKLIPVLGVDELRRDPKPFPRLPDAPLEYAAHLELLAHLSRIHVLPLEGERRSSRRHAKPLDLPESVDDLLGDLIGEELVLRVGAHVGERKDRNGRHLGLDRRTDRRTRSSSQVAHQVCHRVIPLRCVLAHRPA